jgi:hypothetical protein
MTFKVKPINDAKLPRKSVFALTTFSWPGECHISTPEAIPLLPMVKPEGCMLEIGADHIGHAACALNE